MVKFIIYDIDKSIEYFNESSNYNNIKAKNLLGIIYKCNNEKKNICFAIEYFKEAKNYSFSLYNLARIYYFGIDIERDIQKSIDLLKIASEDKFEFANIFLFYIFTYCDDEKIKNENESVLYLDKISDYIGDIFKSDQSVIIKLEQYLKQFDLFKCNDNIKNFVYYLLEGEPYDPKTIEAEIQNPNKKPINDDFYRGFYDN